MLFQIFKQNTDISENNFADSVVPISKESKLSDQLSLADKLDVPDASTLTFPEDDGACLTSSSVGLLEPAAMNPDTESISSTLGLILKDVRVTRFILLLHFFCDLVVCLKVNIFKLSYAFSLMYES